MVEWQARRRRMRVDWFRVSVWCIAFAGCAAFWVAIADAMI